MRCRLEPIYHSLKWSRSPTHVQPMRMRDHGAIRQARKRGASLSIRYTSIIAVDSETTTALCRHRSTAWHRSISWIAQKNLSGRTRPYCDTFICWAGLTSAILLWDSMGHDPSIKDRASISHANRIHWNGDSIIKLRKNSSERYSNELNDLIASPLNFAIDGICTQILS